MYFPCVKEMNTLLYLKMSLNYKISKKSDSFTSLHFLHLFYKILNYFLLFFFLNTKTLYLYNILPFILYQINVKICYDILISTNMRNTLTINLQENFHMMRFIQKKERKKQSKSPAQIWWHRPKHC